MQQFKLPSLDRETASQFQDHGTDTSPGLRIVSKQNSDSGLHPGWYNEPPQRETWQKEFPTRSRYPEQWNAPASIRKPFDIEKLTGRIHLIIYGVLAVLFIVSILLTSLWRIVGAIASLKLV